MMSTTEDARELPGVDLNDARKRLFDDEAFLITLLGEFVRHGLSLEDSLTYELDSGNLEEALRKAHQLRGGAANLAAKLIESRARHLEEKLAGTTPLQAGNGEVRQTIDARRNELRSELERLRNALLRSPTPIEEPPVSHRRDSALASPEARSAARVLIIDDSDAMRSYLRVTITKEMSNVEVTEASDGLAGYRSLIEEKPDLALCDLQMPQFDGMKLLTMRATRPELREIPIIMLTAEHEMERKVEVLNRGAADYVTKPFHGQELIARVRIHLGLKQLKDELHDANAKLEKLATTDQLTSLFNRRRFDHFLREEIARTVRYNTPLSLIMIDLDFFKKVNDEYGHAMGDTVLQNVGALLQETVRATDRAARFGGEELAVILPHTTETGAQKMSERIREAIENKMHQLGSAEVRCTASLGVAGTCGAGSTIRSLLRNADRALYSAKAEGRNRVIAASQLEKMELAATGGH